MRPLKYCLSPTRINNARPKCTTYKLSDGGGLFVEISPGGQKSWRYQYRLAGKRQTVSIGRYPEIGVADARDRHFELRALVEKHRLNGGVVTVQLLGVSSKSGRFTCGKRLINVNPCAGIRTTSLLGPRPPVRKRPMVTRQELHLLLNAQQRRPNALAIRLLLATGVRGSELFTARWTDMHLHEGRWHIPDPYRRS